MADVVPPFSAIILNINGVNTNEKIETDRMDFKKCEEVQYQFYSFEWELFPFFDLGVSYKLFIPGMLKFCDDFPLEEKFSFTVWDYPVDFFQCGDSIIF
jgi:hypothetical protein